MCIRDRHKAAYEKLDDLIGPHTVRTKAYEAMKPLMTPFEGTQKLNANTEDVYKRQKVMSGKPDHFISLLHLLPSSFCRL